MIPDIRKAQALVLVSRNPIGMMLETVAPGPLGPDFVVVPFTAERGNYYEGLGNTDFSIRPLRMRTQRKKEGRRKGGYFRYFVSLLIRTSTSTGLPI